MQQQTRYMVGSVPNKGLDNTKPTSPVPKVVTNPKHPIKKK